MNLAWTTFTKLPFLTLRVSESMGNPLVFENLLADASESTREASSRCPFEPNEFRGEEMDDVDTLL